MKSIIRSLVLFSAFALPAFAFALQISVSIGIGNSCGASSICQLANTILFLINEVLVPLIFAISFLVFLYGVFKQYIWSKGDEAAVTQGHTLILWGIIGFVVMVSLWGLVNVVANTFGLGGYTAPPLPVSYPTY